MYSFSGYRKYLFHLYLSFNVFYAFYYMTTGYLGGDFYNSGIVASNKYLLIAIFQILIAMFLYARFFFFVTDKLKVKKRFKLENKSVLDYFIFIISVCYIYYSLNGGLSYSKDVSVTGWLILFKKLNVVFEISYILLIYLFYRCGRPSKIYFFNLSLIVLANLIGGRTGILLYIIPIFYIMNASAGKKVSSFKMVFIISLGLFVAPIVRLLKFSIGMFMKNDTDDINAAIMIYKGDGNIWDVYVDFFNLSFERFQHVSNLSFLIEKSQLVQSNLPEYSINNHFTISVIKQFFYIDQPSVYLNAYFASFINGSLDWSVHTGVAGVYYATGLIGVINILVYSLLLIAYILYSKLFDDAGGVEEYAWLMTLLFFIHGWFSVFYATFYALIIFSIIIVILNYLTNKFRK